MASSNALRYVALTVGALLIIALIAVAIWAIIAATKSGFARDRFSGAQTQAASMLLFTDGETVAITIEYYNTDLALTPLNATCVKTCISNTMFPQYLASLQVLTLNGQRLDDRSQLWKVEIVNGNTVRLKNVALGMYLSTSTNGGDPQPYPVAVMGIDPKDATTQWVFNTFNNRLMMSPIVDSSKTVGYFASPEQLGLGLITGLWPEFKFVKIVRAS